MIITLTPYNAFGLGETLDIAIAPFFVGPPGPGGSTASAEGSFTNTATWTLNHSLTANPPHVTVVDSAGRALIASVDHVSATQVTVTHNSPQTGIMRLS